MFPIAGSFSAMSSGSAGFDVLHTDVKDNKKTKMSANLFLKKLCM
jgi:hypothetical protein